MDATDSTDTTPEAMYGCILAGGSGTRLWPLSVPAHPKQFLPLPGPDSMFQETLARLEPLVPLERLYVITFDTYADIVAQQAPALDPAQIVAEPAGRGTAASIGLAATLIAARDPHAVMGSFPADHIITDVPGFRAALRLARTVAERGALVTLGITPLYAETGYGYIRFGAALDAPTADSASGALQPYAVEQFVEKPSRQIAEEYLRAGNYVWNSGIFVWRVDRILEEIRKQVPVVSEALDEIGVAARRAQGRMTDEVRAVIHAVWPRLRDNITIDVGVMEHASNIAVIPISVGWNDIGSWSQVASLYPPDATGNVVVGLRSASLDIPPGDDARFAESAAAERDGECLHTQTNDTLIYSTTGRRIATAGVSGLIIVDTPDGLLICAKEHAQLVKQIAEERQRRHALRSARQVTSDERTSDTTHR